MFDTFLQALFYGWEEVPRYGAAKDLLLKDQILAVMRRKFNPYITILAMAAGLFLMFPLDFDFFPDGFPVRNTGSL